MQKWVIAAGITAVGLLAVAGINHVSLNQPLQTALADDSRNAGIEAWGYHRYLVSPQVATFDLRDVSTRKSRLDVTRTLFQYAEQLKDRRFDRVILAFQGEDRFMIDGDYFQELGRTYAYQNPNYLLRTLPENIRTLDGQRAYSQWQGGMLGVMNRQLQDLNQFHDDWYLDDMTSY